MKASLFSNGKCSEMCKVTSFLKRISEFRTLCFVSTNKTAISLSTCFINEMLLKNLFKL